MLYLGRHCTSFSLIGFKMLYLVGPQGTFLPFFSLVMGLGGLHIEVFFSEGFFFRAIPRYVVSKGTSYILDFLNWNLELDHAATQDYDLFNNHPPPPKKKKKLKKKNHNIIIIITIRNILPYKGQQRDDSSIFFGGG